jgi:GT2 family glycosyltransferase
MFDLVISLVVYKTTSEKIIDVINTALKNTDGLLIKVAIFDNYGDNSLKDLSANNHFYYYCFGKNIGFGAGHNHIIKETKNQAKCYLVLNPDVYLNGQDIPKILNFISTSDNIGLLSPKLINPDGSLQNICRNLPTPLDLILRRLGRPSIVDHHLNRDCIQAVPFIHGACFFFKPHLFEALGGFDERFFLYMEDVDICRRFNMDSSVVYFPDVVAIHEHQRGSRKNIKLFFLHLNSAIKYFNKWGWFSDAGAKSINKNSSTSLKLL